MFSFACQKRVRAPRGKFLPAASELDAPLGQRWARQLPLAVQAPSVKMYLPDALPFTVQIPSRENGTAERPQAFRCPKLKNSFSSEYG